MSDYWEKRAAWDMYERMADAEDTADLVARIYRSASAQIVFSAQDIFEKYMTKHKLSKAEAWRFLNSIQDKDSIQKLLLELKNKDSGENKQELLKELEAPAYRARIERLQGLLQKVDTVMENVYQQEQQFDTSFFEQLAENAYYRTIYNTQRKTGLGLSRMTKMTKEEKAQYMQQKKEKELSEREAAITRKELMVEARNTLAGDGLPQELAEILNYTDADACKKSMETVKVTFQKAVEAAVEEKLKGGKPPKKASEQEGITKEMYSKMGYAERLKLKTENPELYKQLSGK